LSLIVLLDENIPPQVAEYLRAERPTWQVHHARDVALKGASDQEIFDWAQESAAIVITFDEDFADTRMYPTGGHAGVVRLRVWPTTVEVTEAALGRLLSSTEDQALQGV
jgi:predicted nuclease of predicted toxin-antitoxin system